MRIDFGIGNAFTKIFQKLVEVVRYLAKGKWSNMSSEISRLIMKEIKNVIGGQIKRFTVFHRWTKAIWL